MTANQAVHPIETMARTIGVSRSGLRGGTGPPRPAPWPMLRFPTGSEQSTRPHGKAMGRLAFMPSLQRRASLWAASVSSV